MKKADFALRTVLAMTLGLGMAFCAHAGDTWTYTSVSGGAGVDTPSSGGAATLTTTGAYATNAVAGTNCSPTCATMSSGLSGTWKTDAVANLSSYPGLGMSSDGNSDPNHALDNAGVNTEGVLLTFSTSTILTGIDLSYISGDADISVFRYIGTSAPTLSGTGTTLATMYGSGASGWQLVGNYANLTADNSAPFTYNLINGATNSTSPTAGATSVGSSWWLITAYNTNFGSGTGLTQGDDYFKLLAVAGEACTGSAGKCGTKKVPEPGSLALAGLGLFGLVYSRRQRILRKG